MTSLPTAVLALIVIGGFIVLALVGVLVGRRGLRGRVREGHNDVLVPIFLTAGTIYAVLLAFLVIIVWEQYGSAKAVAGEEASILATMYRQTDGIAPAERTKMRAYIRQYTNAVINEEWDAQAQGSVSDQGDVSDSTRKALAGIYSDLAVLPPDQMASPVVAEFTRDVTTLSTDRSKRLIASGEGVPPILWLGMCVGGVVVLAMSSLLFMEVRWPHLAMSSVLAGLIGLMLFLALVLDHPFSGQLKIKPDAFEHATSVFDSVDGGN